MTNTDSSSRQPYSDADFDVEADAESTARMLSLYAEQSNGIYDAFENHKEISYGPDPANKLDVFSPVGESQGVVVFIHGGWWCKGSKESRAFLAEPLLKAGFHFVNIEYPLAPASTMAEIVTSVERAMAWTYKEIGKWGGDPDHLIVAGNSAGGPLAATLCSLESLTRSGVPASAVQGLVGVSGLYDLSPFDTLFPAEWLTFDAETVKNYSPISGRYSPRLQILLAYGDKEPRGFHDQSKDFRDNLESQGKKIRCDEVMGHDHLSIIKEIPEMVKLLESAPK